MAGTPQSRPRADLEGDSGVVVSAELCIGCVGPQMPGRPQRSWGEEQNDAAGARLGAGVSLPGHSVAEDPEMGPHG